MAITLLRSFICDHKEYPVTFENSQTLQILVALGSYSFTNFSGSIVKDAASHQSRERGVVKSSLLLDRCKKPKHSEQVLVDLDRSGLRPATIKELLAFGIIYP